MKERLSFKTLVYVAYGFYILLGLAWFIMVFMFNGHFDYVSAAIVAIFSAQAYFHHKLTNLILGMLTLFFSLFMLLESVYQAKAVHFTGPSLALTSIWVVSLAMSGILVFSYTKLSFKEGQ